MRSYVLALAVLLPIAASAQGPTVYINGDQGVSANSSAFALGGVAVGGASVAKHDKTMEMAQVLLDSCPEISVTVDGTGAHFDYVLLLNQAARPLQILAAQSDDDFRNRSALCELARGMHQDRSAFQQHELLAAGAGFFAAHARP